MKVIERGFSLIEMAIVLVVIGIIISGTLGIAGPIFNSQRAEVTRNNIALVEKAIQVYLIRNGCLPCPATGSGAGTGYSRDQSGVYSPASACTTGDCIVADAVVPWLTIGLPQENAIDGWGNRLRYAVANGTPCTAGVTKLQSANGMNRCGTNYPAGGITVNDIDLGTTTTTQAAYVIVSSGSDRSLALTANTGSATGDRYAQDGGNGGQDRNSDDDASFVFAIGEINDSNGATHFDDIVVWRPAPVLVQRCGDNSCGNPA